MPGEVYLGVRDAHIHLNVLGWAGLTVLTTLVVFGPALLRVRIEAGTEQRASDAQVRPMIGLGTGALGIVLRSLGRSIGDGAEGPATLLLVVGMGIYLQAVVVIALPLLRACCARAGSCPWDGSIPSGTAPAPPRATATRPAEAPRTSPTRRTPPGRAGWAGGV